MFDESKASEILSAIESLSQQVTEARSDIRTLTGLVRDLADEVLEVREENRRLKDEMRPPPPSNGAAE